MTVKLLSLERPSATELAFLSQISSCCLPAIAFYSTWLQAQELLRWISWCLEESFPESGQDRLLTEGLCQGAGCAIWGSFPSSFFPFTWGDNSELSLWGICYIDCPRHQWSCFAPTFFFCTGLSTVFHNNPFWPQQLPGARHQQASIFRPPDVGSVLPRAVLLLTADCLGLALASWVRSSCAPVFSQFSSITNNFRLS